VTREDDDGRMLFPDIADRNVFCILFYTGFEFRKCGSLKTQN